MQVLLFTALRWLLRHFLSLILIIAVLLLGRAAWAEWKAWKSMGAESAQLSEADRRIGASLKELADQINARLAAVQKATQATLETQIAKVDSEIAAKRLERQTFAGLAPILEGRPIAEAQLKVLQIDAAIGMLRQERDWLEQARLRVLATQSEQAQRAHLEQLRLAHANLYGQWQKVRRERDDWESSHWIKSRLPGTDEYKTLQVLTERQAWLLAENRRASASYSSQLDLLSRTSKLPPLPPLLLPPSTLDDALKPVRNRMADLQNMERSNWFAKLWGPVQEVLPTALLILLSIVLTPIAIKALFYFVLAPLATRRPPVRLLPGSHGALTLESGVSSVSRSIIVDSMNELLVHPEFLQSASVGGQKTTQWLLDWRFPLSSLAAGMVALTRIRCDVPEAVQVSATRDVLAEIAVLDLPAGCAVVMQPHNLVGLVQQRDTPVRTSAHWRLASLHAWLTLQLRYLAIHGPVRLIVQGSRGVKVEAATGSRTVNQAATIAFSANVPYSTRRCETFAAYLLGRQELLNDCFGSPKGSDKAEPQDAGFFVYAELPQSGRRAGITGRGLEGLTDSMLKVLGV